MVSQGVVGCVDLLFKRAKRSLVRSRGLQSLALALLSLISQRSLHAQLVQTNGKVVFTLPATNVAASSAPQNLLLKTTSAVSITSLTVPSSQGSKQEYTVGTVTGCAVDGSTVIPSGTTCTVPITFTPAYPGIRPVPLRIVTSGGNATIGLAGSGVSPLAAITPGVISTIAGDPSASGCAAYNGPALQGPQCNPSGVAVDAAGNVYIVSFYSNTVSRIDPSGNVTVIAGTGAGGVSGANGLAVDANIERPADVAIDAAGNVYFADESAQQVFRIDVNTQILTSVAGNGTQGYSGDGGQATLAELNRPEGVAVDLQGNLYIEDQDNNIVRKVDTSGVITTIAGDPATRGQGAPAYGGDGGPAINAGLALCCSGVYASYDSIAVDAAGNLFIGDSGHHVVRKVTTDGIIHTVAGNNTLGAGFSGDGGAATSAQLNWPMGVAVDPAGDLYIADFSNNRIRKVDAATQTISTVVGNGNGTFAGDGGPATAASLNGVQKLQLDGEGNLYVGDTKNNLIRKVTVSGPTVTFPSPTSAGTIDTTDGPQGVIVSDIGNAPLALQVPASGTNASVSSGFSLYSGETGACPSLLPASSAAALGVGSSCALQVNFTPSTAGSVTGSLVLTDNSLNTTTPGASQIISLAGTGTGAAVVAFSPTTLTFPAGNLNVTSAAMSTTLSNTGNIALNISGISITGTNPSDFAYTSTCGSTLAAGASCSIFVTFTPASVASFAATLSVSDDASGSPQTVALTGTGSGGVSASPTTLNMGSQTEYTENYTPQYITLTNNTSSTVTFSNFQSADVAEFYSQAYTCSDSGVLNAGSSCQLSVRFSPLSVGVIDSSITMPYTGGGGGTLVVSLTGTGTVGTPSITLYPLPGTFGTLPVLTQATAITVQVQDSGTAPLTGITFSITGANAADYTETDNCSGVTVSPYPAAVESCNVTVNFTPGGAGARIATLNVSSNGGTATFSTPLAGAGVAQLSQIQFTPTQLNLFAGAAGNCSGTTTGGAATAATLCNINNAAQDYLGNTFLVDTTYNVVYKVDTTGKITVFAGTPSTTGGYTGDGALATSATLQGPRAVAADAFGNVYISDTGNGAIREVDALTGNINSVITGGCYSTGTGKPEPRSNTARKKVIFGYACLQTFQPEGLVFDASGNLFFADPADNFVWEAAANGLEFQGALSVVAGSASTQGAAGSAGYTGDGGPATSATLHAPQDVAVDNLGNLYIADTTNNVVRLVTASTGVISTFAGNGTAGNSGDGASATGAELTAYGVATSLGGDVFIAASTGGLVRKVDTSGTITTFAGGGTGVLGGPASTGAVTDAYFVRADNAGDLIIPAGLQVLLAGPDGLLQFGTESIGTTSAALTATVENTGDSNLSVNSTGTSITGADAADFALSGSTCGTALAPGKTCTISVTFTPSVTGARTAAVSVGTNAAGSPQTILLQGNGSAASAPAASLSPTTLSFPATTTGTTSTALTTTLSNTGNASLTISGITLAGTNPADFAQTNNCGTTLAAGANCTISVTFSPATAAAFTATLSVADNASNSPQTATLSGTGAVPLAPAATLTPSSLTFANAVTGVTTASQTLTLTNSGNAVLNIGGITLGGSNPADFADTTACGATLAAGASCAIAVTFTPASIAGFTATLSVADDAAGSPQTATLTGTGVAAPDFTVASTTPSQTVTAGGAAQYPIVVTSTNGDFTGTVTLSATGLPPGATASFAPASVTPGSSAANSVLTVQTGSRQARSNGHLPWVPISALAFCVPLLWWRKRNRGKLLSAGLLCALLSVTAFFATGCGGGYYLNTSKTYTVTVTGTSGSSVHSTTVTLTIE